MRGSVVGSLWALVLGGAGLGVASLVSEQPAGNAPPKVPQLAAPEVAVVAAPSELTTPPAAVNREYVVTAPRVSTPAAEVSEPAPDTEPAAPPQTLQVDTALSTPTDVTDADIAAALEEPVLPATTGAPPQFPSHEEDVVIATQPAQAEAADATPDDAEVAGVIEDVAVPDETAASAAQEQDAQAVAAEDTAPEVEIFSEPEMAVVPDETPGSDGITPFDLAEAATPADIQPKPMVVTPPIVAQPAAPVLPQTDETPAPVVIAPAPEAPMSVDPAPTTPVSRVRVNRPGATPAEDTVPSVEAEAESEISLEDTPALQRYATAFENPASLPMMSVLVIDDGSQGDMSASIADLPMPVTVVLNALDQGVAARSAAYRAAGVEIAMQTTLPAGAVPTDVEVAFEAAFGLLPEAVLLYEDGTGVVQDNRAVSSQVVQILAADGRGLITMQRGLGTAQRTAQDAGVPATTVLRDLDANGEDPGAIKRGLDQSALRARQQGSVVLVARAQPDTLSVLRDWAQTLDKTQMLLVPASAILIDSDT